MQIDIPETALPYGFVNAPVGTHTSRTLMLAELTLVLAASPPDADHAEFRRRVVEENVARKDTLATRRETLRRLSELYGLRPDLPLFYALRLLWPAVPEEQPLLALLCAAARDPLLRATAGTVLATPPGEPVTPQRLEEAIEEAYPRRYSPVTRRAIGQNTISSWQQAGHLTGRLKKVRGRAVSGPASTAYALLLGYLCAARGLLLYETFWARLLDASTAAIDAHAFDASRRGWIDYKRIGDVAEIGVSGLLPGPSSSDTKIKEGVGARG
jgi:hypothetical protein